MDIVNWIQHNWGTILTTVMGIGVIGAGITKVLSILSAVIKLMQDIQSALADNKLTSEELDKIVADAKGIPIAIKNAFKKD